MNLDNLKDEIYLVIEKRLDIDGNIEEARHNTSDILDFFLNSYINGLGMTYRWNDDTIQIYSNMLRV